MYMILDKLLINALKGPYTLPKQSEPLRNPKSDIKANIKPYQHRGKGTRAERRNNHGKESN